MIMTEDHPRPARQKLINIIKDCGQSLIDNAENITGDFQYRSADALRIVIEISDDKVPTIRAENRFFPKSVFSTVK